MSVKALQAYTQFSKYARFDKELGRKETWDEQINRVFKMHEKHLGEKVELIREDFEFARKMANEKMVLGSQRALQFGGEPILVKHPRLYNCSSSHCDRPRFFQECMHLLLCGCGTGFSVQKHHVARLPEIYKPTKNKKVFIIDDSIEGWADSIGVLLSSYFCAGCVPFPEYNGHVVEFDFSKIRPEGAMISWGSKAPGPNGLRIALEKIRNLMDKTCKLHKKLRPIDAYDIIMHASDAVLSGGVRRSACIAIFSKDDDEMMNAKTGSWFIENPQRGRSNNSVLLIRDTTTHEEFASLVEKIKQFGEPGFIWADNEEALFNPCAEIAFFPKLDIDDTNRHLVEKEIAIQGNETILSGWNFCNLCEINVKKAKTKEEFLQICKAAAILGTIQASYTNFEYLGVVSELIARREALLGVSMTGMADNPDIAFNEECQREGAQLILKVNEKIANQIGISPCARASCIKPAGSTSCILGTASGIHPHHAKRYFRRVQANKMENSLKFFKQYNPLAVEESVWSTNKTDVVITFLCEVPDGAKTKNQVDALTLLNQVKFTQQTWIHYGKRIENCVRPWLNHNVSNTCNIKPDEWEVVIDFIYENKQWFCGISMLPVSGDKDYPQAPFTAIYTPKEVVKHYGDGSIFASGLIVDGLRVFDNNLWAASDCAMGIGEILTIDALREKIIEDFKYNGVKWKKEGLSPESPRKLLIAWLEHNVIAYNEKIDWVRRAKQFASRYFGGDVKKMTHCLKDVYNWKVWCDLSREYVDVDWSLCMETGEGELVTINGAGEACSGGACEAGELGLSIREAKR